MAKPCDIAIIGPGKVGLALAISADRAGWPVVALAGRTPQRARRAARSAKVSAKVMSADEAAAAGRIVLLTVRDEQIAPLCGQLAKANGLRPGTVVVHCSGALGSDILAPAQRAGCYTASMHPLQTFATVQSAVRGLPGTYFFLEGDAPAVAILRRLVRAVGGEPVRIESSAKAMYHAAACIASNYLAALLDTALTAEAAAGIRPAMARKALSPLIRATLENVLALGPDRALTGPIARGEKETVRRHLEALASVNDPALEQVYRMMGCRTVELSLRKGTLSPARARELRAMLQRRTARG